MTLGRTTLLDLVVAAWVVAWVAVGIAVADKTDGITVLSDAAASAAERFAGSAERVESVDLPIGDEVLGELAEGAQGGGEELAAASRESTEDVERLSLLLGLSIALIPTLPVLALYLPGRLARGRELGALRGMLREGEGDPGLERLLAQRAAVQLPYRELRRVSDAPWRDIEQGRTADLARAELRRVGVR
jgi:hypothetical protein